MNTVVGDRTECSVVTNLVNAEETERDDMAAPGGSAQAGAVAAGDASPVEHDRNVELCVRLRENLRRSDRRTKVKACNSIKEGKDIISCHSDFFQIRYVPI